MSSDKPLVSERFPRSAKYNSEWILASISGAANALWMSEWLAAALDLRPKVTKMQTPERDRCHHRRHH
jgi:hypothetical protein